MTTCPGLPSGCTSTGPSPGRRSRTGRGSRCQARARRPWPCLSPGGGLETPRQATATIRTQLVNVPGRLAPPAGWCCTYPGTGPGRPPGPSCTTVTATGPPGPGLTPDHRPTGPTGDTDTGRAGQTGGLRTPPRPSQDHSADNGSTDNPSGGSRLKTHSDSLRPHRLLVLRPELREDDRVLCPGDQHVTVAQQHLRLRAAAYVPPGRFHDMARRHRADAQWFRASRHAETEGRRRLYRGAVVTDPATLHTPFRMLAGENISRLSGFRRV
jgi:hypothetical protein